MVLAVRADGTAALPALREEIHRQVTGRIWILDAGNHRIVGAQPGDRPLTLGREGRGPGEFRIPRTLYVEGDGGAAILFNTTSHPFNEGDGHSRGMVALAQPEQSQLDTLFTFPRSGAATFRTPSSRIPGGFRFIVTTPYADAAPHMARTAACGGRARTTRIGHGILRGGAPTSAASSRKRAAPRGTRPSPLSGSLAVATCLSSTRSSTSTAARAAPPKNP